MNGEPAPDAVRFWVETRLRDALDNDEHLMSALAMFKVAMDHKDTPRDMIRKVLADFVCNALDIDPETL